jgi:hypothetical protein
VHNATNPTQTSIEEKDQQNGSEIAQIQEDAQNISQT